MSDQSQTPDHLTDKITARFNAPGGSPPDHSGAADIDASATDSSQQPQSMFGLLSLAPDRLAPPAFFVDDALSIRWMAPGGTDAFSRALAEALETAATSNVFELMIGPAVKETLPDWQTFFTFIYTMLRRAAAADAFDMEASVIPADQIPAAGEEMIGTADTQSVGVATCLLAEKGAAAAIPLRIFGLQFESGMLFLLRRERWQPPVADAAEDGSVVGDIDTVAEKNIIGVLSLRLDDADRLADAMLPDAFFKMVNRIWEETDGVVSALGGRRSGSNGAQAHYRFGGGGGRNPIFSAICCAVRMNRQMPALQEKLNAQQGWMDEICMNMGISHGSEDPSESAPSDSMEFMIPGGAFDQAAQLSSIAGKGEIWISKNAVGQLPKKLIDQLVVGVDRQGRFIRNFFTRLADLPRADAAGPLKPNLGMLSIARIAKVENQPPPGQPAAKEE
jgi:class 3 adenylate cyclase